MDVPSSAHILWWWWCFVINQEPELLFVLVTLSLWVTRISWLETKWRKIYDYNNNTDKMLRVLILIALQVNETAVWNRNQDEWYVIQIPWKSRNFSKMENPSWKSKQSTNIKSTVLNTERILTKWRNTVTKQSNTLIRNNHEVEDLEKIPAGATGIRGSTSQLSVWPAKTSHQVRFKDFMQKTSCDAMVFACR